MTESLWPSPPSPTLPPSPSSLTFLPSPSSLTSPQSPPSPSAASLALPSSAASTSTSSAVTSVGGSGQVPRPRKVLKVSPDSNPPTPPPPAPVPLCVIRRPLSAAGELDAAVRHLRASDPHLAAIINELKPLSLRQFQSPFLTLARSIIHQQLAPKAAASTYERFFKLCDAQGGLSPAAVLALPAVQLRQIGISTRKAGYLHDLARKFHTGVLSDAAIVSLDDRSLLSMLTMVEGIGTWSAHMFMIFSLHRPDVLPAGDAAVRRGVEILYGLLETPRPSQMEQLCERWRPYRSVGSWYMWRLSQVKVATPSAAESIAGAQHQRLLLESIQVDM